MNNPRITKSSLTLESASEQLVVDADNLVSEFERLLSSELYLLETGQATGLQEIAEAKNVLMSKISAHESMLVEMFEHHLHSPAVVSLKTRLMKCRAENQSNHALVMLELKHTNKSLELLRAILRMDDLSLYSDRGTVSVNREKRRFGSA